jgi:RNA polymerase sigma-70 factor (ECF subfamily)
MLASVTELETPHVDLVNRARRGDQAAFATLYEEFAGYAFAILRRQLGSSPHVEDLLQQVFVKVYRELPEFQGDKPFRAWLRRACYFVVYDHLRKAKRHEAISLDDDDRGIPIAEQEPGEAPADPERELLKAEIRRRSLTVLRKLKPEKRVALVMHDFEGHTLDEAAEVLGCSRFTVRTRVTRARREFAALAGKDKALMQLIGRSTS